MIVEDCWVDQFRFQNTTAVALDHNHLQEDDWLLASSELLYRLDTPPVAGDLYLDGIPLPAIGDTFTRADVDAGGLAYRPENGNIEEDFFDYSISGLTRVSIATNGAQANGPSYRPSISADGQFVAFESLASNLVGGDTLGFADIFVRNLAEHRTTRVSTSTGGAQANGASWEPEISGDGLAVAFQSYATNLLAGGPTCETAADTTQAADVFVKMKDTFEVRRYSVASPCVEQSNGNSGDPAISSNAQFVAFESDATNLVGIDDDAGLDIYLHAAPPNGATGLLSVALSGTEPGNSTAYDPAISDDGAHIAFTSYADNLVNDDNNTIDDVFVRTLSQGGDKTIRVSVSTEGFEGLGPSYTPSISATGRFITFASEAELDPNFPSAAIFSHIYVHDRDADEDGVFDEAGMDPWGHPQVRTDVLPAGFNKYYDDGPNEASYGPSISADGRFVAFYSYASNLVPNDTNECDFNTAGHCPDVFVVDRDPDGNGVFDEYNSWGDFSIRVMRASVALNGEQGDGPSAMPSISDDGRYVAFESTATNLVPGDTNNASDIFVFYTGFARAFPILEFPEVYLPSLIR